MCMVRNHTGGRGFSLVELLVAISILSLLMLLLLKTTSMTSGAWINTTQKMKAFADARAAFDQVTGNLSQAVLNTYWDYDDVSAPTLYKRQSELQFLSLPMTRLVTGGTSYSSATYPTHGVFFQAPTGMVQNKTSYGSLPNLLNAYGYFIEYGYEDIPGFPTLPKKYCFRLREWKVPSENLTLYSQSSGVDYLGDGSMGWISFASPVPHTLAENVIALIVLPKKQDKTTQKSTVLTSPGTYFYNSRNNGTGASDREQKHQLPPEVEIIIVAIEEGSAQRLCMTGMPPVLVDPALFQDPANLDDLASQQGDITKLEKALDAQRIRYIVLRSTVMLRAGRWSGNN